MFDKNYTPASGESFRAKKTAEGKISVSNGKTDKQETLHALSPESLSLDSQTKRLLVNEEKGRKAYWIYSYKNKRILAWPGGSIELEASDSSENQAGGAGALKPLKLTMPGKVLSVQVKEGDTVEAGAALLVVEAMKMENLLLANAKAKVQKIHVKPGDRLESGALLMSFEPV